MVQVIPHVTMWLEFGYNTITPGQIGSNYHIGDIVFKKVIPCTTRFLLRYDPWIKTQNIMTDCTYNKGHK